MKLIFFMQKLIQQLLIESHIFHIKKETLDLQLKSHPEASSIKAITDTLDYFNIKNVVANVPKDALLQLPSYFLAILEEDENPELCLIRIKKNKITIENADQQISKMSISAFKEKWTGTIIAVEKEENTTKHFSLSRYKSKLLFAGVLIFFGLLQILDFDVVVLVHQVLSLIGLYISILIVKEDLGMNNAKVAKFCNAISANSSCNDVIKSKKTSFLKIVSLSDASITFFITLLLITTSIGFNHFALLSIAFSTMIVVLFSVYYQAILIKKWCVLCLGISAVLIAQFCLAAFTFISSEISWSYITKAIGITMLVTILYGYIKPLLISARTLEATKTNFLKFRRNRDVFNFLLSRNNITDDSYISSDHQVVFGNPKAGIIIKAVFNPLCGYCVAPFKVYDTILNRYADDVQVHFIFNISDNKENIANQISASILGLYFNEDKEKAYGALKKWFDHRDFEVWQERFGKDKAMPPEKIHNTISYHLQWCTMNQLHYTPITLIQGNFFPKDYQIEDLLLFVEDMILEAKNQSIEIPQS